MGSVEKPGGLRAARGWFVGLAVVCAAGAGASVFLAQRALDQERSHARDLAATYASQVVAPPLAGRTVSGSIDGQVANELSTALKKEVFATDPAVMLVRVWAPDGHLLYSSNVKEVPGPNRTGEVASIRAASKQNAKVTSTMSAGVLSVFAPLHVSGDVVGAVEVDRDEATVETAIERPWILGRTVAAGAVGLFVLLTLVSFIPFGRRRDKRLAGKAFTDGASDDAPAAESSGASGKGSGTKGSDGKNTDGADVDQLKSKLEKAEEGRRAVEMELGQLRAQIGSSNEGSVRRVAQLEKALEIAETQMKDPQGSPAMAALEAKVKDLESALVAARSRAAEVESRSGDMAARYGENQTIAERSQSEAESARSQLAAAEARANDATAALVELERRVADGEAAKSDLKAQISKLDEELRWARAQTTEAEPILQEATAKALEEKARAEELLDRATRAEARFEDAETRSAQAEARAAGADERAQAAESRIAELESRVDELGRGAAARPEPEPATAEAPTAAALAPTSTVSSPLASDDGLAAEVAALRSKLEHTEVRAKRAYAEAESARAELAKMNNRSEPLPEAVDATGQKSEVDRLGSELARVLERAHAAEERSARMEAELVALHNGLQLGDGPASPVPMGWSEVGPPRRNGASTGDGAEEMGAVDVVDEEMSPSAERNGHVVPPTADVAEPTDDDVAVAEVAVEGPSLRSRLAKTAAQKKGRARDDRSPRS